MALSYNPRASTSYLYATEVLPQKRKMLFGSMCFCFDGLFTIFAAYFFLFVRDQNTMMMILGSSCLVALTLVLCLLPESPSFLLITGKMVKYRAAMNNLAGQ
mmetsp:Transcript_5144/g.3607  ORF Transcript_5144/g.3607 Transcript_5144/m.3607 type:complete len:102 (+) Transcript_5144:426-731(+)